MSRIWAMMAGGLAAISLAGAAQAQSAGDAGRFSLGLGLGTNGGVVEGAYRLSDQLVLRGQGAFLDFDYGFHSNDAHYAGRFHFNTGGGFVDWHPLSSPWLLTAGAVTGERKVKVSAKPTAVGSITIHGVVYPITEVGSVVGDVDYGDTAPLVGVGWDNTFFTSGHWGVRAIAGVAFGDHPPSVALHAIGPFANDPTVLSNLQAEQVSLRDHAGDYSYYPVVQVGLTYRF